MDVMTAAAAVIVPIVASEIALGHTKVQTRLARAVAIWAAAYAAAVAWLVYAAGSGIIAVSLFWGGAFLVWFGVRSHIESSILLRMVYLLRRGPLPDARLLEAYAAFYGESARLEELRRGGLIADGRAGARLTPKGKIILSLASKLGSSR
jgi:hypothetical protein